MTEERGIMNDVNEVREKFRGRGLSWNRIRGDAVSRIVTHYLTPHLSKGFKVARLAWVEGCSNEFDILIVDEDAEPIGFTGEYPRDKVRLIIEVKASGIFYKKEEVERKVHQLFELWRKETGKPILYLTFWEAQSHVDHVLDAIGKDTAFILSDEKSGVRHGEWNRFLQRVESILIDKA